MPSGQTHDRITLWLLPWLLPITLLLTRNSRLTLIVTASFLFSGLMFGPDLDIYSVQFKRWGKLRVIWLPYQKCLNHRSLLSHGFILGTVIRLLYLFTLLLISSIFIIGIAQMAIGFEWNWQQFLTTVTKKMTIDHPQESMAVFWGLELGSMSHSLADWTNTAYKKYQKQGLKGIIKKKPKSKPRRKKRISPSNKSKPVPRTPQKKN